MTRIRAASTHFAISAAIACAVIALIYFVWYPQPLFAAVGGPMLMLLIIGIDAILGPTFTLILFNPKKTRRALAVDLTMIAVLQLSALAYGMYAAAAGRPAFVVFCKDQFFTVLANELDQKRLAEAPPELRSLSFTGPKWVGTRSVTDLKERSENATDLFVSGVDLYQKPKYYVPLEQSKAEMLSVAQAVTGLKSSIPGGDELMAEGVRKTGVPAAEIVYVPLRVKSHFMTVLMRRKTAEILTVVDLDPWETQGQAPVGSKLPVGPSTQ